MLRKKQEIRNVFGISNSSIHTSDNMHEAIDIARMLFNQNSLHFLNYANPYKFSRFLELFDTVKDVTLDRKRLVEEIAIDGGMVLGAYGLREPNDVDVLSITDEVISPKIDNHNFQEKYYDADIKNIISDKRYYFVFEGIKFVSYETLKKFKKKRFSFKDKEDLFLMKKLDDKSGLRKLIYHVNSNRIYYKSKIRIFLKPKIKKLLLKLGIFEQARNLKRQFKRSK